MKYLMKQKFFSWGDDFSIEDEAGREVFFVDGKVFSFGKQLTFKDSAGDELAYIKQKLLTFMPKYEIYRNGNLFAILEKEFSFFNKKFTVDIPGPNDLTVDGNFFAHEFSFVDKSGRTVAQASKAYFSFTDSYGINIEAGQDDVIILASAVAIDMILHNDND